MKYIWLAIVVLNIVTFCLYGIDKRRARKSRWRIPEATLLWFAFFGGSVGALFAMMFFHHKTKHTKFYLGVPLMLILQLALGVYLYTCL